MGGMMNIDLLKLEKIHYVQLKIIKEREKAGLIGGKQITGKSPAEIAHKLKSFLGELFAKSKKGEDENLLGLHYYVDVLRVLPLDKVKELEIDTCKAIKAKKELYRQKINAGNLDKIVRGENGKDKI
jgi:hypothetical protein